MRKRTSSFTSTILLAGAVALALGACRAPSPPPPEPVSLAPQGDGSCAAVDPTQPVCGQVLTTGQGGLIGPIAICDDYLASSPGSPTQPGCTSPLSQAPGNRIAVPINMTAGSTDLLTLNGTDMCMPQNAKIPDPKLWYDDPVLGLERYACLYTPNRRTPAPLLIYVPGSESDVSTLYTQTNLRAAAELQGFVLAGVQAFNTHQWSDGQDGGADAGTGLPDGQHFDYFFRDFSPGGCNHDVRFLDWLIDTLVQQGTVDPTQVYMTGWSNGAFFSMRYALERHASSATLGGNHVAAASVYAGADPWGNIENTGCGQAAAYPSHPGVPIQVVHRTCDAFVPCWHDPGDPGAPENAISDVTDWMTTLATQVGDTAGVDTRIDPCGAPASACLPYCTSGDGGGGCTPTCCSQTLGGLDHINWPTAEEPAMLSFLFSHPL